MKKSDVSRILCAVLTAGAVLGAGAGGWFGGSRAVAAAEESEAEAADGSAEGSAAEAVDAAAEGSAADAADGAAVEAAESAAEAAEAPAAEDGEGKVLNICCFNEEFKTRMVDHYPTYVETDSMTGRIGDVTIRWTMMTTDDDEYQETLDALLSENESQSPDDRIDLFLAEDDFLGRYVDAAEEVTIPISELGITEEELAGQFEYTKQAASDRDGVLRGLTWQCTPGVLIYNRQAAVDVWGTDDPKEVQKHVATWEDFQTAADELKEKEYSVASSTTDTFRVYADNTTTYWVTKKGKVNVPTMMQKWAEASKLMVDDGEMTTTTMWSAGWSEGLMPEGKVFCCFGPAWVIDYCLSQEVTGSLANTGGWAVCPGPQGFFWRGTWLCAAKGTDNRELIADILRTMTTDELIMDNILRTDGDFVNNRSVMEAAAKEDGFASTILGGQNPLPAFLTNANRIEVTNRTRYDAACEQYFRSAMKRYFEGTDSYDEAVLRFRKRMVKNYPEVTYEGAE